MATASHDIYFVNQVGGNELWKNLGGGRFRNITAAAGVGRRGHASAWRRRSRTSTTTATRISTSRPSAAATCLFENDGRGHFKDISHEAGVDLHGALVGRRVLRLRQGRPARSFLVATSDVTRTITKAAGRRITSASKTRSSVTSTPIAPSTRILYRNLGRPSLHRCHGGRRAEALGLVRRRDRRRRQRRRLAGSLPPEHAGRRPVSTRTSAARSFVEKSRKSLPEDVVGSDGHQGLRLRQRRPSGSLRHRHALRHERDASPAREKEKARRCSGRRRASAATADDASGATRSSTRMGPASSTKSPTRLGAENYWPWGPSVGDLNADGYDDVFIASGHELPVPLRDQLAACSTTAARSSWTRSSCSASSRARGPDARHRGSSSTASGKATAHPMLCRRPVGQDHGDGARSAPARRRSSTSTATAISTSSPTTSTPRRWCSSATWRETACHPLDRDRTDRHDVES